jgi:hypothetical protein
MKLILSLSNLVSKTVKAQLPRLYDEQGNNPGVQKISSHSTQVSWQFQIVHLSGRQWEPCDDGTWLLMAVESYSRFTILNRYYLEPSLEEIEKDFMASWIEHLIMLMQMGGFVRNKQNIEQVTSQFQQLKKPEYYRNLDSSIGGHIGDNQQWLRAYIDDTRITEFNNTHVPEFSNYLNQLSRRIGKQRKKADQFLPFERFLDDGLYRFASGLCDQKIPYCRFGDFPNPYRSNVELSLVKS